MKLNIYDPDYLLRLEKLQIRRKKILKSLSLEDWDFNILKVFQSNLIGPLKTIIRIENLFSMQKAVKRLLHGKKPLIMRLEEFSKDFSLPPIAALEWLFWVKPSLYPPPSTEMIDMTGENDIETFVLKCRQLLKKSGLENFVELQAALMKAENSNIDWLVNEINQLTIYNLGDVETFKQLYLDLSYIERSSVIEKLRCHPYIKAILTRRIVCPMILDGSNIVMYRQRIFDIDFILERISQNKEFYYPFLIVFDKNILYFPGFTDSPWYHSPSIILHSPADELIIKLSMQKKAIVISSDRFSEWNPGILRIDPRRFFE